MFMRPLRANGAGADTLAAMQLLRRTGFADLALVILLGAAMAAAAQEQPLRVGSKRFTESYILAEVLAQTAAPHAAIAPLVRQGPVSYTHLTLPTICSV